MSAKIYTLKDSFGDQILPRTTSKAVYTEDGYILDDKLADIQNTANEASNIAANAVSEHNSDTNAHSDIRQAIANIQVPVQSVNGKTGAVSLSASDVSAVSKSGDTMTANLVVENDGWPGFTVRGTSREGLFENGQSTYVSIQNRKIGDNNNRVILELFDESHDLRDILRLRAIKNGSIADYPILHTGNKDQIFTYGTADLTAGSSSLETGKLYFVYE